MSGLFSIFSIANRGMSAQQKAINVTSHNIANANTEGYSRQRAVMETTRPFGMPTMNNAAEPGQIGTGAQISAVERVRDSFLDYQVRTETSTLGKFDARDKFLSEIEGVFNEPSDTGISTLIGKFFDSWQQLSKQSQSSNSRTIVAQQAATLTDALNHTAVQLQKIKENTQSVIKDSVFQVNDLLNQLNELNKQIIGVKVAGNMPNDLMDKRDNLLDQLSSKFNINVDKKSFEGYDIKPMDLASSDSTNNFCLVKSEDNNNVKRFSYIDSIVPHKDADGNPVVGQYDITYFKLGDRTQGSTIISGVQLTVDQVKEIDENRVIWAEMDGTAAAGDTQPFVLFKPSSGELTGYMSVQHDVDSYSAQLDKLAKAMAFAVNAVHSGKTDAADDKMPFFVNFQNKSDEEGITALNISVNSEILRDPMNIKTKTHDDQFDYANENNIDGDTDGSRALAIAQLRDKLISIENIFGPDSSTRINSREELFTKGGNQLSDENHLNFVSKDSGGTKIDNYFKDVIDKLGVQAQEAQRMVKNQNSLLASFKETKDSISGVSLDEEMANLVQYQHAYQANAKVIATVDELLDVVVNGLKK